MTWSSEVVGSAVAEVVKYVITFAIAIYVEYRFGIANWLVRIWHRIKNSDVFIKINIVYESTTPFESLKGFIKDGFREQSKNLSAKKDSSQSLEFMVDDSYQITVYDQPNNEVSILTNKIKSTMQGVTKDVQKILNVLDNCKEKSKEWNFKEKEFSLSLYLPYKDPFTKIYPPKDIKIKDYEIELAHNGGSIIKLKADVLKIHTKYRHSLEAVIRYFV